MERFKTSTNVVKIKKKSIDASADFEDGSLDAVYIDGDRRYESVIQDLTLWLPKIKKGGFISGHDYCGNVRKAIINILGPIETVYPDTSWVRGV